jgi:thiamine biosynthesis lipoprotein
MPSSLALLLAATLTGAPASATVERRVASMGTTVDLAVRAPDRAKGLEASEAALRELDRVEALLTTWRRGGDLDRIDRAPSGEPVAVSRELLDLLTAVFAWSPRTEGAFDPTAAPLVRAWDLRGRGRIPAPAELASARAATGVAHFRLDVPAATVTRLDPEAGIEEGAWGKGYGLDRAAAALKSVGIRDAMLDLGGQVLAIGTDPDGRPWRVPVADPRNREGTVAVLAVTGVSVSTSGDSERSREAECRRIGHILDPRTGEPAADFGSVTVVAPSGLVADVLSTAFFVLGPERGLALSERLRREGVAQQALFLVVRGDRLEADASPGFSSFVSSADPRAVAGLTTPTP